MSDQRLACANVDNLTVAAGLTTTGAGPWCYKGSVYSTVTAVVTTTSGNGSATVNVELSNGPDSSPVANITAGGTITITSGATPRGDGLNLGIAAYKYIRLNVTAITGTGAAVNGYLGT
jgi:hypothetical protein